MKAQQNLKVITVVISLVAAIFFSSCKMRHKSNSFKSDDYRLIEAAIEYTYRKSKFADTVFVIDTVLKYNFKDYKNTADKFYDFSQYRKKRDLPTIIDCADSIYNKFSFKDNPPIESKEVIWNVKNIRRMNHEYKSINKLKLGDRYMSFAHPLYDSEHVTALIKVNRGGAGEIIFLLKKENGEWKVKCELYISMY